MEQVEESKKLKSLDTKPANGTVTEEVRVYKRRWIMLALFVLCSTCNATHWLQYSIIANIIMRYYNVSALWVNWTSMIYMAAYIPLVLPAAWLLDRKGLRVTLILGAFFMTAGSWVKVGSADPDRFYVAFIGQLLVGAAQIFILGVPARLAAVWFGPRQVSTACAIGVFGNQIGIALGFLLPPALVKNHENVEDIGRDLLHMYLGVAACPTVVFILILLVFRKAPPIPPSPAQAKLLLERKVPYMKSLKKLVTNRNFILLFISYGINIGVFYAVSTLLNQVLLPHHPNAEEDAGRIGLTMTAAGIIGSVIGGIILDRTHKFKETTVVVYSLSLSGMIAYTFVVNQPIVAVYIIGGFLGFFMTGYLGIGYEFAAELTYPVAEGTSSGLLNAGSEIFGVLFTVITGKILEIYKDFVTNVTLICLLSVGLILTFFIRGKDLRRQAASEMKRPAEVEMINIPA